MKKILCSFALLGLAACGLQVRDDPNTVVTPNASSATPFFTVGGTATGIPYKKDVTVKFNGKDYPIAQNGPFTIPTPLTPGTDYQASITDSPGGAYVCTIENATGTAQANVSNMNITCECDVGSLGSGSGTSADPTILYSAGELNNLAVTGDATTLSNSYLQVCDLDYTAISPTPIGDSTTAFTGQFNGGGFFILHYRSTANNPSKDGRKGIFGYVLDGYIKNVNLSDVVIQADATTVHMGGLVGTIEDASILTSYAENIRLDDNGVALSSIGGLVGYQVASTSGACACCLANLNNLHVENVNIDGMASANVGAVGGETQGRGNQIEVTDSLVQSLSRAGGLIGYVTNDGIFQNIDIQDVSVEGNTKIGGIAGESKGSIQKAAFVGSVSGKTSAGQIGGIVGSSDVAYNINHSYTVSDIFSVAGSTDVGPVYGNASTLKRVAYDTTTTCENCSTNTGAIGLTTNSSIIDGTHSVMSTWSFYDTWCLVENTYPRLMSVPFTVCP